MTSKGLLLQKGKRLRLYSKIFITVGSIMSQKPSSTILCRDRNCEESNAEPSVDIAFQLAWIRCLTSSLIWEVVIECMKPGTFSFNHWKR